MLSRSCCLALCSCIYGALGSLEFLILLGNPTGSLSPGTTLDLIKCRNAQNFPAFQTVNVITNEGVGIQVLDCQHDLLHGDTVIRPNLGRDGPEGVGRSGGTEGVSLVPATERPLSLRLPTNRLGTASGGRLAGCLSGGNCRGADLFLNAGLFRIHGGIHKDGVFPH